jgi:hypothetical protein
MIPLGEKITFFPGNHFFHPGRKKMCSFTVEHFGSTTATICSKIVLTPFGANLSSCFIIVKKKFRDFFHFKRFFVLFLLKRLFFPSFFAERVRPTPLSLTKDPLWFVNSCGQKGWFHTMVCRHKCWFSVAEMCRQKC